MPIEGPGDRVVSRTRSLVRTPFACRGRNAVLIAQGCQLRAISRDRRGVCLWPVSLGDERLRVNHRVKRDLCQAMAELAGPRNNDCIARLVTRHARRTSTVVGERGTTPATETSSRPGLCVESGGPCRSLRPLLSCHALRTVAAHQHGLSGYVHTGSPGRSATCRVSASGTNSKELDDCDRGAQRRRVTAGEQPRYRRVVDARAHGQSSLSDAPFCHCIAHPAAEVAVSDAAGKNQVIHESLPHPVNQNVGSGRGQPSRGSECCTCDCRSRT